MPCVNVGVGVSEGEGVCAVCATIDGSLCVAVSLRTIALLQLAELLVSGDGPQGFRETQTSRVKSEQMTPLDPPAERERVGFA